MKKLDFLIVSGSERNARLLVDCRLHGSYPESGMWDIEAPRGITRTAFQELQTTRVGVGILSLADSA